MTLHWHISPSSPLTLAGCDVWKVTSAAIQIPLDFSPWVQIFLWLLLSCCCRYTARAWSVWLKPAVVLYMTDWWLIRIVHSLESWVPLTPQREVKSHAVLHVPWQRRTNQAANVAGAWAQSGVSQQIRSWRDKTAFIFLWKSLFLRICHECSQLNLSAAARWSPNFTVSLLWAREEADRGNIILENWSMLWD